MVLETLLLALQLTCIALVLLGSALLTVRLLPARGQAVLALLSDALDAVVFSLVSGETTAHPSSPRRSFSAPRSPAAPPRSPLAWPGVTFPSSATLPPFAWEKPIPLSAASSANIDVVLARLDAWADRCAAETAQRRQQKKTVRFAREVQVREISPASPRPAPTGACPPVVEPFDTVAWLARLEAFSAAIRQPDCSVLAALSWVAPVQQQQPPPPPAPAFFAAEIPQPAPPVFLPPSSPPNATPAPPPAPAAPTTTACGPETPQHAPPPSSAPPAASLPPSFPAPAVPPAPTSSAAAPASKAASPPLPPPVPAAPHAQPPSAAAPALKAAPTPSSSSSAAAPQTAQKPIFDPALLSSMFPDQRTPAGLTKEQHHIRSSVEHAMKLSARLAERAPEYRALFPNHAERGPLQYSWALNLSQPGELAMLEAVASGLVTAWKTLADDEDRLAADVVGREMLGAVLLAGKRWNDLVAQMARVDFVAGRAGMPELVGLTGEMRAGIGKVRKAVDRLKKLVEG